MHLPPFRASRFPFPAGIDSLARIKREKKKNGDIACEISFQLLEISIQRIRLIVVRNWRSHSFVRSFHIFSRILFSPHPSFQLACHKKKKLSGYCEKSWRQSRKNFSLVERVFRAIFERSRKIVGTRGNYYYFSRGCSTRGNGGKETVRNFDHVAQREISFVLLGIFLTHTSLFVFAGRRIKMDCIFYENLLLRRGRISHKYIFGDGLSTSVFSLLLLLL